MEELDEDESEDDKMENEDKEAETEKSLIEYVPHGRSMDKGHGANQKRIQRRVNAKDQSHVKGKGMSSNDLDEVTPWMGKRNHREVEVQHMEDKPSKKCQKITSSIVASQHTHFANDAAEEGDTALVTRSPGVSQHTRWYTAGERDDVTSQHFYFL